jgi:PKD repeat protein
MSYLRSIARWLLGGRNKETPRRRASARRPNAWRTGTRPALEQLESRDLLSGLTVSILGSPTSGHSPEGKAIFLASSLNGTTPGMTYGYSWQVLKNNVAYTASSSSVLLFTPNDDASYQVTLNVRDRLGHTATASNTITVDDVAPTVYLAARYSGTAMVGLTFHAAATSTSSADMAAGFSYTWNFGDGSTPVSGASPTHTYAQPGKYSVTVTATDLGGGISTTVGTTASIVAPPAPAVALTGWPLYGYTPEGTALTLGCVLGGTTAGVTYTESWQVWKGSAAFASSNTSSIHFTPDDAAYYRVSLTVTDQFGTIVTKNLGLYVHDVPPVVHMPSVFGVDIGSAITFSPTVSDAGPLDTAAGFRYVWNFGDGTTSSAAAPSHTYAKVGTYPVMLTVYNADGLSASASAYAKIAPPPSARFSGPSSVGAGTTNAHVTFTGQVGGTGGYTYSYDFDNNGSFEVTGSTSPTVTIPESYLDNAPVTVTVHGRITDSLGAYTDYTTTIKTTDVPPTPSVTFTPNTDTGQSVTFAATATDPSTAITNAGFTYRWTFGDGTSAVAGASPSHTYSRSGKYAITLTATDKNGGTGSITRIVTVAVPPTATFSGPSTVGAGTTTAQVKFTNQLGGIPGFTYSYDFDNNGSFEVAGSTSPFVTIPESYLDNAPVTLTVHGRITDSAGGYHDYTTTIKTTDVAPKPSITLTPNVDAGVSVTFDGSATDPSTAITNAGFTYSWSFGDGTSPVSGASPSHTYSRSGKYAVTLTATDKNGGTGSITLTVNVEPLPTATFSGPSTVSAGATAALVKFTNQIGGSPGYTYSYDFDDDGIFEITGSTSPTFTIPESYVDNGPATITVHGRITDSAGGYHDYTTSISVTDAPPTPSITLTPNVDAGQAVTFEGSATDPSTAITNAGFTYTWDFGDGSGPGSGASPSHTYSTVGKYAVTLTATDKNGGTGSISLTVNVEPLPTATFSGPPTIDKGTTAQVTFTDQTGGSGGYTYSYDFSNSGTFNIVGSALATATVPDSVLSTEGPHVIHARITDGAGGYTDYTFTIVVNSVSST